MNCNIKCIIRESNTGDGEGGGALQDEGVEISELKLYGNLSGSGRLFSGNLLLNVGQTGCLQKTTLKLEAVATHCIAETAVIQRNSSTASYLAACDAQMCVTYQHTNLSSYCADIQFACEAQSVETSMSG